MDRGMRADPLIRHTVLNKSRCSTLETSGYGQRKNRHIDMFMTNLLDADSSSVLFPDTTGQIRPLSMQAAMMMNNTTKAHRRAHLDPVSNASSVSNRR